jgi:hypothetical protein
MEEVISGYSDDGKARKLVAKLVVTSDESSLFAFENGMIKQKGHI